MKYFKINGGKKLSGKIAVNGSKNATVALLAAAMINKGKTTLKNVPQIEEVNRWVEILESIGVKVERQEKTIILTAPAKIKIENINIEAAQKTRSAIMLISGLIRNSKKYFIPQAGGCKLGARTIKPHLFAIEKFGVKIKTIDGGFEVNSEDFKPAGKVVLYESGDTVTETALIAAAQSPSKTIIKMATANYMVQDICFFLEKLGVKIKGIGTGTLEIVGLKEINKNVTYEISEDPIEAMFFISTAIVTKSKLVIERCPIEFLELELLKLEKMGQKYNILKEYKSKNNKTDLVDLEIIPSKLTAPEDKLHGMPFPGINMDNLPFFVPIVAMAEGRTLIHDWSYENRAIYFVDLNRLGAKISLLDPHRVYVEGPIEFKAAEMMSPPALRPAAIILVAMLAAKGNSILRDVYSINRGYENLEERLRSVGAEIELKDDESSLEL
ncbi:MAG: UDP-N-acetylglucosamine transferase [Candidatus Moranbacteria bacterium GW2011_GWE1_35_17]|nr:MAG: UDP-N-acetylglucosamine transferase [Candidatus Moranbacteria bacterium GW2011_GWE1_35_17]KKP71802.1 MAG: UDP-N-acetylglucosamine transferase [Candidatus Moranbacteria bacterium GW2011_GWE2_35_164]KKP82847.1 MAG: UDP-N-acetylglucosamine transferase [Candidatus Moranbacteria bacterium GW2011_GWF1_35_5]KKP84525.1 MAG: UDP-N-acetylglucosamine transferase [Candidatus Moranbacteria bacterium GW2011_GWF2_35_54]